MAQDDGQERTEQPTPKRLRDAKEKGQVARSRELSTAMVMLTGSAAIILFGERLVTHIGRMMQSNFTFSRQALFDSHAMIEHFHDSIMMALSGIFPVFFVIVVAAIIAPVALGGWLFSIESLAPKMERLDPVKGLKKVFGVRGVVEMLKALAKFLVIGSAAVLYIWLHAEELLSLIYINPGAALTQAANLIAWGLLLISASLIIIAMIDVPFQLWDHQRQLKMTRQEIKDEHKQTEGSPEVKARVRRMQMEMAQRRMMQEVPKADVVITNPTHFAIALRYDQDAMGAPRLVAKGADHVAAEIRKIAVAHEIPVVSSPPLARAVYYSTELEQEIPEGLYIAVAQVLAYTMQLRQRTRYYTDKPIEMDDLPIPDDLQHE
jgi:flagellar biosynthetic protein FlhB